MLLRNFMRGLPAFKDLTDRDVETLAMAMRVDSYPDGHVFVYQDKIGKDVYLIIEGEVLASRYGGSGRRIDLKMLKSGELFGLLSLSDSKPAAATCSAVGPVKAASLPFAAYRLLLQSSAPIAHHFQFAVAEQLARDLRDRNRALREQLRRS